MFPAILSKEQRELLPFVQSVRKGFYLVGGTAIALQIGHRQSIDFDLFKKTAIRREKLANQIRDKGHVFQLLFANAEGFHVVVNGVKLTFFQFPFEVSSKLDFEGIRMPSLLDLAAMKAYALGRRAKWKDYIDLYFVLRDHHRFEEIAQNATAIFGDLFSTKLFRQQLCYFEDVDYSEEVSFMSGHEVETAAVKSFLCQVSTQRV